MKRAETTSTTRWGPCSPKSGPEGAGGAQPRGLAARLFADVPSKSVGDLERIKVDDVEGRERLIDRVRQGAC